MHGPGCSFPEATRNFHLPVFGQLPTGSPFSGSDTAFTLTLLSNLGLQIYFEKSILTPSRSTPYIGAILDSTAARAFLPRDRLARLTRLIQSFQPHTLVTAHKAQQLLGLMASTTTTVQHTRLKMRSLQAWLLHYFNPLRDHLHKLLRVSPELSAQLTWWTIPDNLFIGHPFHTIDPSLQVTTDASPMGWWGTLQQASGSTAFGFHLSFTYTSTSWRCSQSLRPSGLSKQP